MNSLALTKVGIEQFLVDDGPDDDADDNAYVASLSAKKRLSPIQGGDIIAVDDIERFTSFIARKSYRDQATSAGFSFSDDLEGVSQATKSLAEAFMAIWPSTVPAPEVSADSDGEVSFDWAGQDGRNFSVSLREDARLAYAGAYGAGKTKYGTEVFNRVEIPEEIVEAVRKLWRAL